MAEKKIKNKEIFQELFQKSCEAWDKLWRKTDIKIEGDRLVQKILRMHIYHLLIAASYHNKKIDAGITARGLTGESYRGHIFWDEIFILPFYNLNFPEISKALIMYRFRRLDAARKYAKSNGYKGAMFPWQSGSKGNEETQNLHLNPISGKWNPDFSRFQRHVSLAIAYNIWNYYWITNDKSFLEKYGAEIFLDICNFWASMSKLNNKTKRYEIQGVMGPDEFHEKLPNSDDHGLKNNSYTNIMVVWALNIAFKILKIIGSDVKSKILSDINIKENDLKLWDEIRSKLYLSISENGIIEQFDGYFGLREIDWKKYKKKYHNIARMDRILKADGKSPDNFKVAKQADTLMIFYLLSIKDIKSIFNQLGYKLEENALKLNFNYYFNRTFHGSTLSKVVHSYLAEKIDKKNLGYRLFMNALLSDYTDTQGGTTKEGIHTGVMASTLIEIIYIYAGLNLYEEQLSINPNLPKRLRKIEFSIKFKNKRYFFVIGKNNVRIKISKGENSLTSLVIQGREVLIDNNKWNSFLLNSGEKLV